MAIRTKSRRRRFEVEGLESRRLLALAYQFAPYAVPATTGAVAVGPNGNTWFGLDQGTNSVAGVGSFNATTGAMTFQPLAHPQARIVSMIDALGAIYFAEQTISPTSQSFLGVVNPSTGAIVEFPLAVSTSGSQPVSIGGIAAGADGNIYFTDTANNAIGKFVVNDAAHPITETQLPKANQQPIGLGTGPNGVLYFGYKGGIGSYNPATQAFAEADLPNTNPNATATASSFAVGGDGRVYFSETFTLPAHGPAQPLAYGLGSIDPTAPLTTANIATLPYNALSVASEPNGNIAFTAIPNGSPTAYGVGEFDTTAQSATITPLPSNNYTGTVYSLIPMPIAVGPTGTISLGLYGALGLATEIPSTQATIFGTVADVTYVDNPSAGRPGQLVYLDLKNDGKLDPGDPSAVTDASGSYVFNGLAPGTYTIRMVLYPGAVQVGSGGVSTTVTVTGGQAASVGTNFSVIQTSILAPLSTPANLFGTNPPDIQTAEATAYYQTILGRAPDTTWLNSAVSYLKGGGSLSALANALLTSPEYDTKLVASFYQNFLNHTASVSEINAWVTIIQQQHLSTEQVAIDFLTSDVFYAQHPTNTSFIQALFEDLDGRQPLPWELASWLNVMGQGVTRNQAVASLVRSTETLGIALGVAGQLYTGYSQQGTQFVTSVQAGQMTLVQAIAATASLPAFVTAANKAVTG